MKSKKQSGKHDINGQRSTFGWALAVSVFVLVFASGLAMTQTSNAAWPPALISECVGRTTSGGSCSGALYGICNGANVGENGCFATPTTCDVTYTGEGKFVQCFTIAKCPDKDLDGRPECTRASVSGPAPSEPTGGKYSADSYLSDCNDSDPWSHTYASANIQSVTVDFEPSYVKTTQSNKMYTPKSPYDLLDTIKATITFSKKCGLKTPTPNSIPMSSILVRSDGVETFISGTLSRKVDFIYEMAVNLTSFMTEEAIASIAKNPNWRLKFVGPDMVNNFRGVPIVPPIKDTPKYQPLPMTNCAQVYGSGNIKTVFMRGSSPLVPLRDLQNATAVFISNYTKSEPFKSYLGHFKHYMDLAPYYDNYPFSNTLGMMNHYVPQDAGSCGKDKQVRLGYHFLISNNTDRTYTNGNGRTVLMEADDKDIYQEYEAVALHEFGHVFANLADEYIYSPKASLIQNAVLYFYTYKGLGKNCSTQPATDFSYGGKLFGGKLLGSSMTPDYFAGCSFGQTAGGKSLYRPSNDSLMRQDGAIHFNVVSCGQILKAIKKTKTGAENFSECATKKDAIIPVGQ